MTDAKSASPTGPHADPWWQLPAFRRLSVRLAVLTLLIAAYLRTDWTVLQKALRSHIARLLRRAGHRTTEADVDTALLLAVDAELYAITANCTYVDLALTLAPLYWRRELPWSTNARRLAVLAMAILLGNVVRTSLALHLTSSGVSWTWAHTVPDTLIRSLAVGGGVLSAVRDDWGPVADTS
jgi:hypothetical protein